MKDEHADNVMMQKGYKYRCIPLNPSESPYIPMYAKTLIDVSRILKDWPEQRFTVITLDTGLTRMENVQYPKG